MGKRGQDKLVQDDDFHVALLHLAVKEDDILAVKDLMRVPAWIQAADRQGRNSLHWAVAFGTKESCSLLISQSGDEGIHHADKTGRTPLHFAAIWGRSDVAKMILARGAQVNAPDRKGMTALHYAAQNSNPFLIRSLIKRAADKQAKDSRRRNAYQVAVTWGSPQAILDLLDPDFIENPVPKVPEMPQARRFAELLSPRAHSFYVPPFGTESFKDYPAELVKFEMQKQADKTRNLLRTVVAKKMKKIEPPEVKAKEFALKALAARRRKTFVEYQMKKTAEQKRMQQVKIDRKIEGQESSKSSGKSSRTPSRSPSPRGQKRGSNSRNAGTGNGTSTSRSRSKSPKSSSYSTSPTASPRKAVGALSKVLTRSSGSRNTQASTPPTYSRPNTPHAFMPPAASKPIRPNPKARDGWPSPPDSIRGGQQGSPTRSSGPGSPKKRPSRHTEDRAKVVILKPRWRAQPIRMPSPQRQALHEFVGTSARHNALGKNPSPAVHQCVDVQKLQNQWL